jgi:hypothetical protein
MPHLSWSEVRERAIRFTRHWSGATSERSDKRTFYNEFFDVFGIRRASLAAFEANVRNLDGNTSAIDLLWRGTLLVEHKTRTPSRANCSAPTPRWTAPRRNATAPNLSTPTASAWNTSSASTNNSRRRCFLSRRAVLVGQERRPRQGGLASTVNERPDCQPNLPRISDPED